ncbi:acyl carrier protein [Schaalia vaccimaxillae]|uniref:acyl carrier protein n=1 Tax=Schaalia vaccimaxillae TaxID=183916 RepID=UPI0003B4BCD9|nr:acyl carrier protein [Schaalia vaccimaxillae]
MGTIAELLGYQLGEFSEDAASTTSTNLDSGTNQVLPDEEDPLGEIAMAAILRECDLEPEQARGALTLRGDLDCDELSIYAIVAAIEHEAGISLPDEQVKSWQTVDDVLKDVRSAAKK